MLLYYYSITKYIHHRNIYQKNEKHVKYAEFDF